MEMTSSGVSHSAHARSLFLPLIASFLLTSTSSSPITRQVGISENVFITVQNDTYGIEQRVCSIDSVTYEDGDSIPTSSPCEHCICRPPGFACTIISCEYRPGCKALKRSNQCCPEYQCECEKDGKIYQNGEKILDSNNPCEICYCQGGDVVCAVIDCYWRSDCQPRYIENRCCPLYDHCPPSQHPGPIHRLTSTTTTTTKPPYPASWFNMTVGFTTTEKQTTTTETTTTTTTEVTEPTTTKAHVVRIPSHPLFGQPLPVVPVANVEPDAAAGTTTDVASVVPSAVSSDLLPELMSFTTWNSQLAPEYPVTQVLPSLDVSPTAPSSGSLLSSTILDIPQAPEQPSDAPVATAEVPQLPLQPSFVPPIPVQPTDASLVSAEPSEISLVSVQPTEVSQVPLQPSEAPSAPMLPSDIPEVPAVPSDVPQLPGQSSEPVQDSVQPSEATYIPSLPSDVPHAPIEPSEISDISALQPGITQITMQPSDLVPVPSQTEELPAASLPSSEIPQVPSDEPLQLPGVPESPIQPTEVPQAPSFPSEVVQVPSEPNEIGVVPGQDAVLPVAPEGTVPVTSLYIVPVPEDVKVDQNLVIADQTTSATPVLASIPSVADVSSSSSSIEESKYAYVEPTASSAVTVEATSVPVPEDAPVLDLSQHAGSSTEHADDTDHVGASQEIVPAVATAEGGNKLSDGAGSLPEVVVPQVAENDDVAVATSSAPATTENIAFQDVPGTTVAPVVDDAPKVTPDETESVPEHHDESAPVVPDGDATTTSSVVFSAGESASSSKVEEVPEKVHHNLQNEFTQADDVPVATVAPTEAVPGSELSDVQDTTPALVPIIVDNAQSDSVEHVAEAQQDDKEQVPITTTPATVKEEAPEFQQDAVEVTTQQPLDSQSDNAEETVVPHHDGVDTTSLPEIVNDSPVDTNEDVLQDEAIETTTSLPSIDKLAHDSKISHDVPPSSQDQVEVTTVQSLLDDVTEKEGLSVTAAYEPVHSDSKENVAFPTTSIAPQAQADEAVTETIVNDDVNEPAQSTTPSANVQSESNFAEGETLQDAVEQDSPVETTVASREQRPIVTESTILNEESIVLKDSPVTEAAAVQADDIQGTTISVSEIVPEGTSVNEQAVTTTQASNANPVADLLADGGNEKSNEINSDTLDSKFRLDPSIFSESSSSESSDKEATPEAEKTGESGVTPSITSQAAEDAPVSSSELKSSQDSQATESNVPKATDEPAFHDNFSQVETTVRVDTEVDDDATTVAPEAFDDGAYAQDQESQDGVSTFPPSDLLRHHHPDHKEGHETTFMPLDDEHAEQNEETTAAYNGELLRHHLPNHTDVDTTLSPGSNEDSPIVREETTIVTIPEIKSGATEEEVNDDQVAATTEKPLSMLRSGLPFSSEESDLDSKTELPSKQVQDLRHKEVDAVTLQDDTGSVKETTAPTFEHRTEDVTPVDDDLVASETTVVDAASDDLPTTSDASAQSYNSTKPEDGKYAVEDDTQNVVINSLPNENVKKIDPIIDDLGPPGLGRSDLTIQDTMKSELSSADEAWYWRAMNRIRNLGHFFPAVRSRPSHQSG